MPDQIEQRFGRRLRQLRRSRRLTQAQLGEACSLSTKFIGAMERGEQNPTLRVLQQLATGLDVDVSELVRMEDLDSVETLRAELKAKLKAASDEEITVLAQLVRVIMP